MKALEIKIMEREIKPMQLETQLKIWNGILFFLMVIIGIPVLTLFVLIMMSVISTQGQPG